jgi:hypothetical protein
MAEMYARRVLRGDMEIWQVPAPWRERAMEIVAQRQEGD